ncbi:stAR-related lipid transfer protein 6-like [Hyperolius riggenbachi]|uniref:stAR-related lipid transfer protein 6-like n=1 Tax=Hyperolius riggenbachi TaxID=752182 RepID=UPI0035A2F16C
MDYQKLADDVSQKILTYYQDSSGWKVVKSTKGITVSWKPSNEYSGNVYRGEGIIEEVPEKVIPYMYLAEYRRKWDKAVKSYSLVDRIDQNTVVSHAITHTYGFGIISSREFVDMVHIRKYDGGVISTNSISIEHEKCPITSSHIRGFNNPCGYICSPLPDFHPIGIKNAIPSGQMTRVSRIVSDPIKREEQQEALRSKFRARGYPSDTLSDQRRRDKERECRTTIPPLRTKAAELKVLLFRLSSADNNCTTAHFAGLKR